MDMGIRNRIAIVTGSSEGIGKAIALNLAKEGVKLVLCARNQENLKKTSLEIEKSTGTQVLPITTNLQEKKEIKNLISKTVQKFGSVDILINNTGGPPQMIFKETSEKHWINAYNQLMMSTINCCYEVIPIMKKKRWGRIVNMTSVSAKQPIEGLILSNAIRAGLLGFTKTLSNEVANDNILVNSVCPGWTLTKRLEELASKKASNGNQNYLDIISEWEKNIPLKRLAKPEEIANMVVFLSSEKASYVTGK